MRAEAGKGQASGRGPRPLASNLVPACAPLPIAGWTREAAGALPALMGDLFMFRFTAQGRIGQIQQLAKQGLRISIAADRLAEGPSGQYTRTEWLGCISFDPNLNSSLERDLEVGMAVQIEGRIEPRKRVVDDKPIYDTSFLIERVERLSKPKPKAKEPAVEAAA